MSDSPRRDVTENDDTRRDDIKWNNAKGDYIKGAAPTTGRKFKVGKDSAPREGRKKKYEKISSFFGRITRASAAPVRSLARSKSALTPVRFSQGLLGAHQRAGTTLQLAYPPFMLSAGIFMFYF